MTAQELGQSVTAFVRVRQHGEKDDLDPLHLGPSFYLDKDVNGIWRVRATDEWLQDVARMGEASAWRKAYKQMWWGILGGLLLGYGIGIFLALWRMG